jgi:hypothetical protein
MLAARLRTLWEPTVARPRRAAVTAEASATGRRRLSQQADGGTQDRVVAASAAASYTSWASSHERERRNERPARTHAAMLGDTPAVEKVALLTRFVGGQRFEALLIPPAHVAVLEEALVFVGSAARCNRAVGGIGGSPHGVFSKGVRALKGKSAEARAPLIP